MKQDTRVDETTGKTSRENMLYHGTATVMCRRPTTRHHDSRGFLMTVNPKHPLCSKCYNILRNEEYEPCTTVTTEDGSDTLFPSENEELQQLNTTALTVVENKSLLKMNQKHQHIIAIHCDFAENLSIVLPGEVKGYHWQNDVISIFTAVPYFTNEISFATVSEETGHNSSHDLIALQKIKTNLSVKPNRTTISDGAASNFKI
ncbi:hypothetical protein PR048_011218 [Dryococelus australis]|uniref:Uncharacterized protein n=1 Tax=Dryococelus australis TaxID=614101 RepID=A0ABQ9HLA0_9NEOP|nr:hypothetical protein PR048_011218 [Dryococelus australis]